MFWNPGYRPYMFENITYNIFQGGKKLVLGCIDHKSPCISSNSIGVLPNSTTIMILMIRSILRKIQVRNSSLMARTIIIFPDSHLLGQGFSYNATKEPCLIISLKC